jgi:hypothetical protein
LLGRRIASRNESGSGHDPERQRQAIVADVQVAFAPNITRVLDGGSEGTIQCLEQARAPEQRRLQGRVKPHTSHAARAVARDVQDRLDSTAVRRAGNSRMYAHRPGRQGALGLDCPVRWTFLGSYAGRAGRRGLYRRDRSMAIDPRCCHRFRLSAIVSAVCTSPAAIGGAK